MRSSSLQVHPITCWQPSFFLYEFVIYFLNFHESVIKEILGIINWDLRIYKFTRLHVRNPCLSRMNLWFIGGFSTNLMWVPSMAPHIFSNSVKILKCAIIDTNLSSWGILMKWEYNFCGLAKTSVIIKIYFQTLLCPTQ